MDGKETIKQTKNEKLSVHISDEIGVIGKLTKVRGNIQTKGHITVEGTVLGNIAALGSVIIRGTVQGLINCKNLIVESSSCEIPKIVAYGTVIIKEGVTLKSDINCEDISIAGKFFGDIIASGKVELASTAEVIGDIDAKLIAADFGSKVKGSINIG